MKIFSISPTPSGDDFLSKDIVHRELKGWLALSNKSIDDGNALDMKWNVDCDEKSVLDLIPSTAPGLVFSRRAFDVVSRFSQAGKFFTVNVDGLLLHGIKQKNFGDSDRNIDHIFNMMPRLSLRLVTQDFVEAWESGGLTGATFKEIGTMDDDIFISPDKDAK